MSIVEVEVYCSYCNRHFGYGFAIPEFNASARTTIYRFTECLSTIIFHTTLLQIKKFTSRQKICCTGPMPMKFTCLNMFPHHLEVAGLIEWWNGLLKTVTVPLKHLHILLSLTSGICAFIHFPVTN